jgi:hypothetical protein
MDEVLEEALGLRTSSKNSQVTMRVSRLLARLGYERRRSTALPRAYQYFRVDVRPVPPSHRPSTPAHTSELPFAAPLPKESPMKRVRVALNPPRRVHDFLVFAKAVAACLSEDPLLSPPASLLATFSALQRLQA